MEEFLAQLDLAVPQRQRVGLSSVPLKPDPAGNQRIDAGRDLFIFVDQLDMCVEEPLHLVS